VGFVVIGGAFSEGIDLLADRLIGAMIIGVGMPKINFKSDQIKDYYKNNNQPGYEYAYLNPGLNKVMQALGRVIRDEDDRGVVLLLDERYTHKLYQNLFSLEQKNYEIVFSNKEVEDVVTNFFKK
jgi:DNA excision repair protein ERCC-2